MSVQWTRRAFLAGVTAATASTRGHVYPDERARYADPSTELEVLRLSSPQAATYLPPSSNRVSSSKGAFLICASDRAGSMQAFRTDVRSGEFRQLTEAAQLRVDTLSLAADEKSIVYFDGNALKQTQLGSLRDKELCRADGEPAGLGISDDGMYATFVDRRGSRSHLMLATVGKGGAQQVAAVGEDAASPQVRPRRSSILYRRADGLWLANFDGGEHRRLKTQGAAGFAQWSPDGRTVLYLAGNELREHTPDSNTDALVARTSQFASFGRNADSSVFVGASRSKAGPYVLLLLRVSRRELPLCEHKSSDASQVNPAFSPSSQRIYFQSDRHGKMALYSMAVEKLVEKTES